MTITELNEREKADPGYAYRLLQAQEILQIFQKTNGRPATSIQELENWLASENGKTALKTRNLV
jgi:hypothetical protein